MNNDKLIADVKKYIEKAIVSMKVHKNPTPTLDINEDSNNDFDISKINSELSDLLMFKYFLENNCQISLRRDGVFAVGGDVPYDDVELLDKQIEEFQTTEYAKLRAKGLSFAEKVQEQQAISVEAAPASPGIFASFSNWIWGNPQQSSENAANSAKPKPTP